MTLPEFATYDHLRLACTPASTESAQLLSEQETIQGIQDFIDWRRVNEDTITYISEFVKELSPFFNALDLMEVEILAPKKMEALIRTLSRSLGVIPNLISTLEDEEIHLYCDDQKNFLLALQEKVKNVHALFLRLLWIQGEKIITTVAQTSFSPANLEELQSIQMSYNTPDIQHTSVVCCHDIERLLRNINHPELHDIITSIQKSIRWNMEQQLTHPEPLHISHPLSTPEGKSTLMKGRYYTSRDIQHFLDKEQDPAGIMQALDFITNQSQFIESPFTTETLTYCLSKCQSIGEVQTLLQNPDFNNVGISECAIPRILCMCSSIEHLLVLANSPHHKEMNHALKTKTVLTHIQSLLASALSQQPTDEQEEHIKKYVEAFSIFPEWVLALKKCSYSLSDPRKKTDDPFVESLIPKKHCLSSMKKEFNFWRQIGYLNTDILTSLLEREDSFANLCTAVELITHHPEICETVSPLAFFNIALLQCKDIADVLQLAIHPLVKSEQLDKDERLFKRMIETITEQTSKQYPPKEFPHRKLRIHWDELCKAHPETYSLTVGKTEQQYILKNWLIPLAEESKETPETSPFTPSISKNEPIFIMPTFTEQQPAPKRMFQYNTPANKTAYSLDMRLSSESDQSALAFLHNQQQISTIPYQKCYNTISRFNPPLYGVFAMWINDEKVGLSQKQIAIILQQCPIHLSREEILDVLKIIKKSADRQQFLQSLYLSVEQIPSEIFRGMIALKQPKQQAEYRRQLKNAFPTHPFFTSPPQMQE